MQGTNKTGTGTWRVYRWITRGAVATAAIWVGGFGLPAQVLARPGWTGSGVAPAAWWRRAVFYRVRPAQFQDSDGDGVGDLRGIAARLDYVQSLGVDAIVLEDLSGASAMRTGGQGNPTADGQSGSAAAFDDPGALGDFIREASRHQLRVLLTVTPAMLGGDRAALLQTVRGWMNEGAAGVSLPRLGPAGAAEQTTYDGLVMSLRSLLRGFPGGRVLLAASPQTGTSSEVQQRTHGQQGADLPSGSHVDSAGVLTAAAALPVEPSRAAGLRETLHSLADGSAPERSVAGLPLLHFAEDPRTGSADAAAAAALLLGLRGAAIFSFGDEIGLDTSAETPGDRHTDAKLQAGNVRSAPIMQWTPANVQGAPIERRTDPAHAASAPEETQFGAYHPYMHPPPGSLTGPVPAAPQVAVDGNLPAALPDPDTLPGFTTGALPNEPVEGARLNATTEDRDAHSLLNAYRQLIALHHDHATMREGAVLPLAPAAGGEEVVAWVRRAPVGSRTATDVLAVVNLGAAPVTLSLDGELAAMGVHSGRLRPLFTWSREPLTGESTEVLRLPAHGVLLAELVGGRARRR